MKKRKIFAMLLTMTLLICVLASCGTNGGTGDTSGGNSSEGSAAVTPSEGSGGAGTSTEGNIKMGHLAYHTGPFAAVGPQFDAAANFAVSVINENPPLGREIELVHQDIGTIGEGEAAKLLLENEQVDVLLNVAGEYMSYRDWLLDYISTNARPLLPSVHAGSQKSIYGGTVEEPIFRGAPQDADQGIAAAQFLADQGVKSAVVMAVENDGMQLMQDASIEALKLLDIEVLGDFDFAAEEPSYRSLVANVQPLNPEAVIVYCAAVDGGTIVKNAAEIGMSTIFVSGTDWLEEQTAVTAGQSAIDRHQGIYCVGFTHADNPGWDYYLERWEASDITTGHDAENSYNIQYYDLLNVSALAIQKSGSLDIAAWVEAMHDVSMPGADKTKVYTYQEGMEALANGESIDYDGPTGVFEYSPTGVVSGSFGVYQWTGITLADRTLLAQVDGAKVLALSTEIGIS